MLKNIKLEQDNSLFGEIDALRDAIRMADDRYFKLREEKIKLEAENFKLKDHISSLLRDVNQQMKDWDVT